MTPAPTIRFLSTYVALSNEFIHSYLESNKDQSLDLYYFFTYISPLGNIINSHSFHHQQYADDLKLFISLSASDPALSILQLEPCLSDIQYWLCLNGLCLNLDKSAVILIGNRQRLQTCPILHSRPSLSPNNWVDASDKITILGVVVDRHLSMDAHVSSICKTSYYHIRALRYQVIPLTMSAVLLPQPWSNLDPVMLIHFSMVFGCVTSTSFNDSRTP